MRLLTPKTYIIGTGRCGTTSMADKLGGLHEPEPNLIYESTQFYQGNPEVYEQLATKLKTRKKLKTSVIADNKQSFVLPLLREIDSRARYMLLVREPMSCIESFYARYAYGKEERNFHKPILVDNRLRPFAGFPKNWSAFMKCAWYWVEVHRIIFSSIDRAKLDIMYMEEIGGETVRNQLAEKFQSRLEAKRKQGLSKQEELFFEKTVQPMWSYIQTLEKL